MAKFQKESDMLQIIDDIKQIKLTVNELVSRSNELVKARVRLDNDDTTRKLRLIDTLTSKLKLQNMQKKIKEDEKYNYRPRMSESNSWIDNESQIVSQSKVHARVINEITQKELNDIMEESKAISDEEMPNLLKKDSSHINLKLL